MELKSFSIVSVNVNGLNAQNKRGRIFKQLEKLKANVLCLQETHLKECDNKYLKYKKTRKTFLSS